MKLVDKIIDLFGGAHDMNKKYTVFLSSTYDDLREERREVIHALLELDCIPCSMETFPADDDEQFEFIKSVIDECDYYVLIIAGRYGSIGKNGKSFTEMEYRYAIKMEIPVLTFIHNDLNSISLEKSEKSELSRQKLEAFIKYASNGKMVKFWSGKEDLAGKVSRTMISAIKRHPSMGWIRGSFYTDIVPKTFAGESLGICGNNVYLLDEMYAKAIYYKEQNEFEKARNFFECCLILDTEKVDVLREYGGLYYDRKDYKKALFFWEKLLRLQKCSRNYYLCGIAYKLIGDYSKARELGNKGLACTDDGCHSWINEYIMKKRTYI